MSRDDLLSRLRSKFGFVGDGSTDHGRVVLCIDGKKAALIKIPNPHGKTSGIGDALLGLIARSSGIQPGFFKGMLSCTRSRDDYLVLLGCKPEKSG